MEGLHLYIALAVAIVVVSLSYINTKNKLFSMKTRFLISALGAAAFIALIAYEFSTLNVIPRIAFIGISILFIVNTLRLFKRIRG